MARIMAEQRKLYARAEGVAYRGLSVAQLLPGRHVVDKAGNPGGGIRIRFSARVSSGRPEECKSTFVTGNLQDDSRRHAKDCGKYDEICNKSTPGIYFER
jgi:hypothetical protein